LGAVNPGVQPPVEAATEDPDDLAPSQVIHLVVVDDEVDMESLFRLRFRREISEGSLEFSFFNNPIDALEAVAGDPSFDVVITDLNMPEIHGLDLIEQVETMNRPLKVIVLTAYGDIRNIRAAMMRGAFDFLMKPLDVEDLRATLNKAVSMTRRLREGLAAASRARTLSDRNRFVEDVFGRYVSKDVMTHLLESPSGRGASERRDLTLMMADIRGFSHMVEELAPEDSVALLNDYLETATQIILSHNGTIIEILGDGLLVFFGAPVEDPKAPEHAASAALELMGAIEDLNRSHRGNGYPMLALGIGVHTGSAIVGTIGSSLRQKYAALGSSVNLVSRIEDQTIGGQVLISEATLAALGDMAVTQGSPSELRLKGLARPVMVHDLVGLKGSYDVSLPGRTVDLVRFDPPREVSIALVVNNRISHQQPAAILAGSDSALRLSTDLSVDVFDEVVVIDSNREVFGKVFEVLPIASEVFVAVTSVSAHRGAGP
jgi:adenylate cyclase